MCGIAGIYSKENPVKQSALKRMTDSLIHRGPDGEGQWINESGKVGLGHRRLSIIDLTDSGKQPMSYAHGRYTITFNGEIYNYIEIKEDLIKRGYRFMSSSDTEVLLALYDFKKEDCLADLDGMFAFAIWDEKEKTLFCARDRFGEKPFYYHYSPNKLFVFASEMKGLFAYGVQKKSNSKMLFNFLLNPHITSNPDDLQETFYHGISKLEPACFLKIDSSLMLSKKKYWKIDLNKKYASQSLPKAIERFQDLFETSVKRRLRSDVPIGSSLSGGIDSSTIVCCVNKMNHNNQVTQRTFSARFKNFEKDEGRFIESVINNTKYEPFFAWPDENSLADEIKDLLYHQEEPFGTSSIFAQWEVMKLAKQNNVTVLLDGQGADEILAGYPDYYPIYLYQLFNNAKSKYLNELQYYTQSSYKPSNGSPLKTYVKNLIRPYYKGILSHMPKPFFRRNNTFLTDDFFFAHSDAKITMPNWATLKEKQFFDTFKLGLESLLKWGDRNSMAFSREVRFPFLCHELVEFTLSLPDDYKIREGWSKYILRKSFEHVLPAEIAWRRDKIGYETPQERWLNTPIMKELIHEARKKLEREKIIKPMSNSQSTNIEWAILMSSMVLFTSKHSKIDLEYKNEEKNINHLPVGI